MRRRLKRRLLESLLRTGLDILEQPERAAETVRERIQQGVDTIARGRDEEQTLRYVLTFAAGVGVGLVVGILTAPAGGEESRSAKRVA